MMSREHLKLMLENAFTLPRHSDRNASLADSIGKLCQHQARAKISNGVSYFGQCVL